jgi:hypothetical protein
MKNLPEFCNAGNFAQRGLSQIDQSVETCGDGGGIKVLLAQLICSDDGGARGCGQHRPARIAETGLAKATRNISANKLLPIGCSLVFSVKFFRG